MKTILLLISVMTMTAGSLWAIPSEITYQGTLREKGVPVTGTKSMNFSIYNQGNNTPLWSSGPRDIEIKSGLFSTRLNPTNIDWQNVTPVIEVVVQGVALSPREPITATIYANVAGSVTNGSIKLQNLSPEVKDVTIPAGMISLFAGPCPTGWTRFTALDDRFPMGASTYGATGGSLTHSHPISTDGGHSHNTTPLVLGTGSHGGYPTVYGTVPSPGFAPYYPGQTTSSSGQHDHGGNSGLSSSLPPYLKIIFCVKQ